MNSQGHIGRLSTFYSGHGCTGSLSTVPVLNTAVQEHCQCRCDSHIRRLSTLFKKSTAIPDNCQHILKTKPYQNFVNGKIMAIPDYCQLILEIKPYRNFVNEIIMAIPDDCQLIYEIKPYRKFVNEKVMAVQYFCQCLYTYSPA